MSTTKVVLPLWDMRPNVETLAGTAPTSVQIAMEEPIEVKIVDGKPAAFTWNGRAYQVSDILHTWESQEGAWWEWTSRGRRRYYRIQAGWNRHRITVEIYVTTGGREERWVLSHVYD